MKIKKIFNIILCCVLIVTSLPMSVSAEELDVIETPLQTATEYVPGEIVITTEDELIDSSSTFVTYGDEDYTLIDFEEEEITDSEELNTYTAEEKTYVLEVEGDVLEKCKELEKLPGVKYAEPNVIFHTMEFTMPGEIQNSSLYKQHMKWYFDLMQITETWQNFESTGEGIVVAVIDDGFKIDATDFPQNLWTDSNGNHGWNTYKNSADISPIYKKDGTAFDNTDHGTHVAGIIGANSDGRNLIGAAYKTELMLINAAHYVSEDKVPQFTFDDIIEAIDYARENHADIINLSLGGYGTSLQLEQAINRAYDAGIAIFAAAGNDGISTTNSKTYPASFENVIGVMASDKADPTQLAYFSNYDPTGLYYDVVAPGFQILSCSIESGKVAYSNGTSQACPLVAACAALYLSEYPNATVSDLYEDIRTSSKPSIKANSSTAPNDTTEYKLLSAYNLLERGKTEPEIKLNFNTNVTKDESLGYIWGLDEGFTDISKYVTITEGTGTIEYIPTACGIGTGSILNIYNIYGELHKSYEIIVFGDINGDATVDGQDAVIVSCIMNFPDKFTEPQKFASDVDFDGNVTEIDYNITANSALLLDFVFQNK